MNFQPNTLKLLLFRHGLTEAELAKKTGVSKANISRLINQNNCNPTLNTLAPLAQYFEISVSQLIGEIPVEGNDNDNPSSSEARKLFREFWAWYKSNA